MCMTLVAMQGFFAVDIDFVKDNDKGVFDSCNKFFHHSESL